MARAGIIERRNEKSKPRGKPFEKGNKNGKNVGETKLVARPSASPKWGSVMIIPDTEYSKPPMAPENVLNQLQKQVMQTVDNQKKENMNTPIKNNELELIEALDFTNGPNKLTLRFSKKLNRMFRVQIFLNDDIEIRPVTYTGSSTGITFWEFLKRMLKK